MLLMVRGIYRVLMLAGGSVCASTVLRGHTLMLLVAKPRNVTHTHTYSVLRIRAMGAMYIGLHACMCCVCSHLQVPCSR